MTTYANMAQHAIDVPGGALLAPLDTCDLDDDVAAPLVEQGVLQAVPEDAPASRAKATKPKDGAA
jgi:hypothetical protein